MPLLMPASIRFVLVAFLSGSAALLFETLWFRQAGLLLGNSVWASSLVLASFMSGLALGNGLMIRYGERAVNPLRWYAALELTIGLTGLVLVFFLPALSPWLVPVTRPLLDTPWLLNPLRFAVAFLLLLVPSTAMGATLPVLVSGLMRQPLRFGTVLGRLYGWNTLGAVAGALASELVLIGWCGLRGTAVFAAGLNGLAALAAFTAPLVRKTRPRAAGARARTVLTPQAVGLLAAAFLCGAILLALEVLWFRFLFFFVHSMGMTFAIMLSVVLTGIAVGGLIGGLWITRHAEAVRWLPSVAALNGLLCLGTYLGIDSVLRAHQSKIIIYPLQILYLSVPLMLPVCIVSGCLFALLGEALHRELGGAARVTGWLTLANTAGAALGSLAATLLLLPGIGLERSFQLAAMGYGVVALAILWPAPRPLARRELVRFALPAVLLFGAVAAFPSGRLVGRYLPYRFRLVAQRFHGARPVAMREGATEHVVYFRREFLGEPIDYELLTNGYVVSDSSLTSHRYTKLFAYLPAAVHPHLRRALLIGYGAGGTAKALTTLASLESIDVVDLSRDILDMSHLIYPDRREHPLHDPRVRVYIEDGRYFLQTRDREYDLITGEPPPPKISGVVALYTREYFELIRKRLAAGGLVSYWLPGHGLELSDAKAVVQAFCGVFPDCTLWTGADSEWIMLGSREARESVNEAHVRRLWDDPQTGPVLRGLGYEVPAQLGATFLADAEDLRAWARDTLPLTDNWPKRISNGFDVGTPPWYTTFLDVQRTRERFARSALVARLLPEALRRESLDYFEAQEDINRAMFHAVSPDPFYYLEIAHRLLTRTQLRELPLWFIGSNAYWQRAVAVVRAKGARHALIDFHLGARAMVDRRYTDAAESFRAAMERGGGWRKPWKARIYALAMAGRLKQARQVAAQGARPEDEDFFRFLAETFPGSTW